CSTQECTSQGSHCPNTPRASWTGQWSAYTWNAWTRCSARCASTMTMKIRRAGLCHAPLSATMNGGAETGRVMDDPTGRLNSGGCTRSRQPPRAGRAGAIIKEYEELRHVLSRRRRPRKAAETEALCDQP